MRRVGLAVGGSSHTGTPATARCTALIIGGAAALFVRCRTAVAAARRRRSFERPRWGGTSVTPAAVPAEEAPPITTCQRHPATEAVSTICHPSSSAASVLLSLSSSPGAMLGASARSSACAAAGEATAGGSAGGSVAEDVAGGRAPADWRSVLAAVRKCCRSRRSASCSSMVSANSINTARSTWLRRASRVAAADVEEVVAPAVGRERGGVEWRAASIAASASANPLELMTPNRAPGWK